MLLLLERWSSAKLKLDLIEPSHFRKSFIHKGGSVMRPGIRLQCSCSPTRTQAMACRPRSKAFLIFVKTDFQMFHNQVIPCSWEPEALVTMVLDADIGSILTCPSESPTSRGAALQLTTI
jgi:hypothetical protein